MTTLGFSHFNLCAPRELLDRLQAFYIDVVGLTPGPRPPFRRFGYWLYAGEQDLLHLVECEPGDARCVTVRNTFDHVAFRCADLAAALQRLAAEGIAFEQAVVPATRQVQLFFTDPAGNGVELNFADDGV
jgi:catechol-2,3-dioxygenase